jgi:hypothetical protein
MVYDTLMECRECGGLAYPKGDIIWPGGRMYECKTCKDFSLYYPRYSIDSIDIDAKHDAVRLRGKVTPSERIVEEKLQKRIAWVMRDRDERWKRDNERFWQNLEREGQADYDNEIKWFCLSCGHTEYEPQFWLEILWAVCRSCGVIDYHELWREE